jgi:rare lipoprotein A
MKNRYALLGAIMLALISTPAAADPISDFFGAWFGGRQTTDSRFEQWQANVANGRRVLASFYGGGPRRYEPNAHTANGERFNKWGMTAAHRSLPFGTVLSVCYARCAIVRVNDRGPALWTGRSLDLSRGAASAIGMVGAGIARVRVAVLGRE